MDFEVTNGIQAAAQRAVGSPPDLPEMGIRTTAAHAAGHAGVAGTEAAARGVIFRHFGTAPTRGTGTDGGHPGSVDRRMSTRKVDGLVCARHDGITKSPGPPCAGTSTSA